MCFCCQPILHGKAMFHCNVSREQFFKLSSEWRFTRGQIVIELRSALLVQCCWSAWAQMSETPQLLVWPSYHLQKREHSYITKSVLFLFASPLFLKFANRPWRLHPRWSRWGIVVDGFSGPNFWGVSFHRYFYFVKSPTPELVQGHYREKS